MKNIFLFALIISTLSLGMVNCGDSSSTGTDGTSGNTSGDTTGSTGGSESQLIQQQINRTILDASSFRSLSGSGGTALIRAQLTGPFACSNGGDYSISSTSYTYNNCDFGTVVFDGGISASASGSTVTVSYSSFSLILSAFTIVLDSSFSFSQDNGEFTITYNNFSQSVDTTAASFDTSLDGTIDYSEAAGGTITGDLDYNYNGTAYSCSFTDFAYETATDAEWATACSI